MQLAVNRDQTAFSRSDKIQSTRFNAKFSCVSVAFALSLILSGCQAIPNSGPVATEILKAADNKGVQSYQTAASIFDVVDVTYEVASELTRHKPSILRETFGFGGGAINPTIGVGDVLQIIIFEAGPDGLFSTTDSKSTSINVTVQPDGNAAIPYVGPFKFVGNTIESARKSIVERLKTRAVEPDVIITMTQNASRSVTVSGAVGTPSLVQLGLAPETIMEVIAKAGGPKDAPYDSYITLNRRGKTGKALLQTLVSDSSENIYARPGDQIFVTKDPQTFSALGSFGKSANIAFEAGTINLIEATALAGGTNQNLADPKGMFIFRYEYEGAVIKIIGKERFRELREKGMQKNDQGLFPIVYRIDMSAPSSLLVGQNFALRNKDVVYFAHHPSTDFVKFLSLIAAPLAIVRSASTL